MPPAGINLFEKRFLHLQKLLLNKSFSGVFKGASVAFFKKAPSLNILTFPLSSATMYWLWRFL